MFNENYSLNGAFSDNLATMGNTQNRDADVRKIHDIYLNWYRRWNGDQSRPDVFGKDFFTAVLGNEAAQKTYIQSGQALKDGQDFRVRYFNLPDVNFSNRVFINDLKRLGFPNRKGEEILKEETRSAGGNNLLLWGAAALGAFFIFGKKGKKGKKKSKK
jgi:hypothetical protein